MDFPLVDQRCQPRSHVPGQITHGIELAILYADGTPVVGILGFPLQVDLLAGKYLGLVILHPDDFGLDLAQEVVSDSFSRFLLNHGHAPQLDRRGCDRTICHKDTGVLGQITTNPYKFSGTLGRFARPGAIQKRGFGKFCGPAKRLCGAAVKLSKLGIGRSQVESRSPWCKVCPTAAGPRPVAAIQCVAIREEADHTRTEARSIRG